MRSKGYETRQVVTRWGKAAIKVKRWYCQGCGSYGHSNPPGMDGSGLSPMVLKSVVYLGTHLSYRESQEALQLQGVTLSVGQCEQKHHGYAEVHEKACKDRLKAQATQPLASASEESQTWIIETDGVFVMERDKPCKGQCEGREVKQAVRFPLGDVEQRHYVAHAGEIEGFAPLVHGLERHMGMKQNDVLIGVADGSAWIDNLFADLGVNVRILDVFHATEYLETVMLALGWTQDKRDAERASWYRADINARVWMRHYLPDPTLWCQWADKERKALQYLEER